MPARTGVSRYLPAHLVEAGVARMEQLEVSDTEGITALPGASEALATVGSERAAIVTSCTAELAQARIERCRYRGTERRDHRRPNRSRQAGPGGIPTGRAAPSASSPARVLSSRTHPAGSSAARAAGCATIALTTTTPRSALVADLIVSSLANVRFEVVRDGVRVAMAR